MIKMKQKLMAKIKGQYEKKNDKKCCVKKKWEKKRKSEPQRK
jgi:hypothetical protein